MGNLSEDLASKLRRVLYSRHQVQLQPAVNHQINSPPGLQNSSSTSSSESQDSISDQNLAYITQILMDDDFDEVEQAADRSEFYQPLLDEFTSIIMKPDDFTQRYAPPASFDDQRKLYIHEALMSCARAVAANNSPLFYRLAGDLTTSMSPQPSSDPMEKTAVLFLEALNAKVTGTGSQAYRALSAGISTKTLLNMRLLKIPCFLVSHVFANETILRACRGAKRIHIVDYGIAHGCQWPELLHALSQRAEGPPEMLKITGVDYPSKISVLHTERLLVDFAGSLGIDLEYVSVPSNTWELVQPARHPDEFLVVNCCMRLRHLKHDAIAMNQPRKLLFENIHRMGPGIFVMCVMSMGANSPFFMTRFEETLRFYSARMEYINTWLYDNEERSFMERMQAKNVMNVVACEGHEQIERAEKYDVWGMRAKRAGFQQMPLQDDICQKTKAVWGGYKYHENFGYGIDENWLLLGWKDTVIFGMSAWRPNMSIEHIY